MKRIDIFNRTALLTGNDKLDEFTRKRIIIFGVGGVGSWTAETLVRTGYTDITIVDADRVAVSNINRQLPATSSTVGEIKVDVMRRRLLDINPEANITAIHGFYNANTAGNFDLTSYDYIVDAIDSLSDKALLIIHATDAMAKTRQISPENTDSGRVTFFSSMGAALKLDPSRIHVDEFWKVKGCPLAAALRRKFKKSGIFPTRKFQCVYSDELIPNQPLSAPIIKCATSGGTNKSSDTDNYSPINFNKVATNGSLMHITAIFGITLASLIIRHTLKQ